MVGEVVAIEESLSGSSNLTKLVFHHVLQKDALMNSYDRTTVKIYGNVALATHGETVREILGSGNAAQPFQRFTLKQPPLTHVSAATATGAEATLKIWVNDMQWHERSSLYGCLPDERVYVIRTSDEGQTTVQFGDGRTGATLPSGQNNIQAVYRKGIGRGGNLDDGRLALLMTRPLEVKDVINPVTAGGGDNQEALEEARRNAPLTVMTLDRIVSLQDYEDFARAFAGIGKALASWIWDGLRQSVFVTVAGVNGVAVPTDSLLYRNLVKALLKAGDPSIPVTVGTYRPVYFKLRANIKVDPDYQADRVLTESRAALKAQFSFDARELGQPVALSEVIAVLQHVGGVLAVDVDQFTRATGTEGLELPERLVAAMPVEGARRPAPAELLLLHQPTHIQGMI
jgi:predicted phage baseplate assembly protein